MVRLNKHYAASLIGKTVKRVSSLSDADLGYLCWTQDTNPTCLIEFTDGTTVLVQSDPEGNDSGFLDIAPPTSAA